MARRDKAINAILSLNVNEMESVPPGMLRLCQELIASLTNRKIVPIKPEVPKFYINRASPALRTNWGNHTQYARGNKKKETRRVLLERRS